MKGFKCNLNRYVLTKYNLASTGGNGSPSGYYTVTTGGNITFLAGQLIDLQPGFTAQPSNPSDSFVAKYGLPANNCDTPKYRKPVHNTGGGRSSADTINTRNNKAAGFSFNLREPADSIKPTPPLVYLSPNPTIDGTSTLYISSPSQFNQITITTLQGQVIETINNPLAENRLNIATEPRGLYLVKVSGPKNTITNKIIYQ